MPILTLRAAGIVTSLWLACAAMATAQTPPPAAAKPKWPMSAYVFTSFQGSGDGLHLSVSDDGKAWTDLGKVFLNPTVGSKLMRDPHILRGPDGVFRMVWTTGWKDRGMGYAASTDLVHWSEPKYLPFMETVADTQNVWAPETVYDEATQQYVIIWSSDVEGRFAETKSSERMNHRAWYVTTKDFATFSAPKVLFDPGFANIDTTLIKSGGRYVAVFKESDRQKAKYWGAIRWAVADRILGPWTLMPEPILTGQRAEGPTLVSVGDKTRLYVDYYAEKRYGVYETRDWTKWTDVSADVAVAKGQRHGTVLSAPAWLVKHLETAAPSAGAVVPVPAPPAVLEGFTADPSPRIRRHLLYLSDVGQTQLADHGLFSLVVEKSGRMEE